MLGTLIALLASLGVGTSAIVLVIKNLLYICQPNEVLIFAGSSRKYERRILGYRTVKGGRSIRTPIFERAYKMDLTNMIIDLKVANAYSKGGIPLTVNGVANIKIAGEEPTIHNAIERLLGKTRKQIETIARETLEGNLRGVLSSLTPEQVNEDKIAFAKSLLEEAEDDLEKLGLLLDNLQIQNISDDVGYLDSLGRKQGAELVRDARIAEAQAHAESVIQQADNDRKTSIKRIETQIEVARAEAERRVQDALTKRKAVVAESESQIASELARTQADVLVQNERIKQVEQQLQADVVAPAEASCQRAIAQARGKAASIIEDGKAQAEGTKRLAESWQQAGPNAREIFLFQKLETLLDIMVTSVPEVDVQQVTVIDAQGGTPATKTASFLEQLRQTTGIDVTGVVNRLGGGSSQLVPTIADHNLGQGSSEEATRLYAEVQQLLNKLAEKNPSQHQTEETVKKVIKRSPQLKSRLRRALEAGGDASIDMLFEHPLVNIPNKMIEAWLEE
ncbi:MAG: SPFH domain-containing protein [Spirulinaceae cyanobacterium]